MREPDRNKHGVRVYGVWAGNPDGKRENKYLCATEVYDRGWMLAHQCFRHRGHGPSGEYCRQHAKMMGKRDASTG